MNRTDGCAARPSKVRQAPRLDRWMFNLRLLQRRFQRLAGMTSSACVEPPLSLSAKAVTGIIFIARDCASGVQSMLGCHSPYKAWAALARIIHEYA